MTDSDRVARFVEITRPYHERLFRIAVALCRDNDTAADLTQEALVRAYCAFHRFRPGDPVLPWLARILKNYHLDTFKTGRARHEVAAHQLRDSSELDPLDRMPTHTPDPLTELERSRLAEVLAREVEALDPDHRLVLILCDIEDFSYKEAAEIAGIPVGTVRSRLARCREHLRQRLGRRGHAPNQSIETNGNQTGMPRVSRSRNTQR